MEGGHTHEWENIIVFVEDGKLGMVAGSCHGEYEKDNQWTTKPWAEDGKISTLGISICGCFR